MHDCSEDALSRRDALVQQLLEERRQRLVRQRRHDATQQYAHRGSEVYSRKGFDESASLEPKAAAVASPAAVGGREHERWFIEDVLRDTALSPSPQSAQSIPASPLVCVRQQPVSPRIHGSNASWSSRQSGTMIDDADVVEASIMDSALSRNPLVSNAPVGEGTVCDVLEVHPSHDSRRGAQPDGHRPRSAPPRALSSAHAPGCCAQDFHARLQEWTQWHQAVDARHNLARQEKEMKELQPCTFRPALNSKSEFFARRSRGCSLDALSERLHHGADMRETLRRKAKDLLEADQLFSCTFCPQINPRGPKQTSRTPIHLRAGAGRQTIEERFHQKQAVDHLNSESRFQPTISERSAKMMRQRRGQQSRSMSQGAGGCSKLVAPVSERLYAEAQHAERRRLERQNSAPSCCSPRIDAMSKRMCRSSRYFQGEQQDFITRQQTFALARQRRMELRAQHADPRQLTFQPKISEASRDLVANNFDLNGETTRERINRLAVKDPERRDHQRTVLEQLVYRECTFKPQTRSSVSATSTKSVDNNPAECGTDLMSNLPAHERLYRSAPTRPHRVAGCSVTNDCRFKPQMHPSSIKRFANMKAHYASTGVGIMDNIQQERERKEEILKDQRREMEEDEMARCTFAPQIHEAPEEPQQAALIPGLERFLELRNIAQRRQQELQQEELRIFRPEKSSSRCGGMTIPEPFAFSTSRRDAVYTLRRDSCTPTPRCHDVANRTLASTALVC